MSLVRPSKKVFLQVLWNGTDTSIPSLFLFTDKKRYVFNCGEGIQRLFTQRKIKLGKLDTFFLTRYQWSHMGGLPGFGMTLRDMRNDAPFRVKIEQNSDSKVKNVVGSKNATSSSAINEICNNSVGNEPPQTVQTEEKKCTTEMETKKHVEKNESCLRKINVYAPKGMKKIISATKHFLRFDDTTVNFEVTEHLKDELEEYKDEEFILHSIPIYYKTDNKQTEHNPKNLLHPPCLSYVCHLNPLPGKFDVKHAKKLGVPVGPLFGMLQQGETVVLENGNKVTPQEVLGSEIPGPIFLLIDCPSVSYIESLTQNSNISKYFSQDEGANLVLHLSSEEVCQDKEYNQWTKRFPSFTKHMYLNSVLQESVPFESQHCLQIMLNRIDSKFFPLTEEHKTMKEEKNFAGDSLKNFSRIHVRELIGNPSKVIDNGEVKCKIDQSELLCRVNKALKKQKSSNNEDKKFSRGAINIGEKRHYNEDGDSIPNKKVNLDIDSKSIAIDSKSGFSSQIYPKIICLGTGASLPSKYRNVSATLVLLSEHDAVLLDCGEGTYGELFRHYGDNVEKILSKIKLIFISHMHADHHLGLITLITKLNSLQKQHEDSVLIMAPSLLLDWLTRYADVSESLKFKFMSCKDAYHGISILQNIHVQPVKVYHPGIAHGLVFVYNNDLKITYSGDTMPCNSLISAGKNSKLLIHEATLEDDMVEDAKERQHSTTTQAMEVAQEMNAEFILLTHFSQRYPKIPILKNNLLSSQTAYAFDHMEITLNDIPKFCELIPSLNAIFSQENDNDNGKIVEFFKIINVMLEL